MSNYICHQWSLTAINSPLYCVKWHPNGCNCVIKLSFVENKIRSFGYYLVTQGTYKVALSPYTLLEDVRAFYFGHPQTHHCFLTMAWSSSKINVSSVSGLAFILHFVFRVCIFLSNKCIKIFILWINCMKMPFFCVFIHYQNGGIKCRILRTAAIKHWQVQILPGKSNAIPL